MVRTHSDADARPEGDQVDIVLTYYERTKNGPPSPLLIAALAYVPQKGDALDLGCGALQDTRELLSRGFRVTAVDRHPAVAEMAQALPHDQLKCIISTFADFQYGTYDLVNASFCLPFNPRDTFDEVFALVMHSIKSSGIFTGQLFGINHSWNTPESTVTFHTQEQVERLFNANGMQIVTLTTEEDDRRPIVGPLMHWHIFQIIARKR
ncbi:MAG: class I SAM-dependent methyltransferase [Herpetosiphon sp.]